MLVALAVRAVLVTGDRWAIVPVAVMVAAAGPGLLVSRRGAHRSSAADERAIARDVSVLVTVVTICGAAATLLIFIVMGDAG